MKKLFLSLIFSLFLAVAVLSFSTALESTAECDSSNICVLYGGQVLDYDGQKIKIEWIETGEVRLSINGKMTPIMGSDFPYKTDEGYNLLIKDIDYDAWEFSKSFVVFSFEKEGMKSYCDEGECLLYTNSPVYFKDRKIFIDSINEDSVKLRIGDEFSLDLINKGVQETDTFYLLIREIDYDIDGSGVSRVYFRIEDRTKKDSGYYCEDSDNGLNKDEKGKTFLSTDTGNVIVEEWDFCSSNNLIEYYCDDSRIEKEIISCKNGCDDGRCMLEGEKAKSLDDEELVKLLDEEIDESSCGGCFADDKCYPIMYQKEREYCSPSGEFVSKKSLGDDCSNNEECFSGSCVSEKCVNEGLIQRVLKWFTSLFG